jgi:hypothetical protein
VLSDSQSILQPDLSAEGTIERDPFDMIMGTYETDTWMVDIAWAKIAETRTIDEDLDAWVLYYTYVGLDQHQIDAYYIYTQIDGDLLPNTIVGTNFIRMDHHMIGLRAAGDIGDTDFSYKGEVAYTFGDTDTPGSDGDVDGWALQLGVNFHPDNDYNASIGFMYTFLEGDEDLAQQSDVDGFFAPWKGKTYGEIANVYVYTNAHIFNLYGGMNLGDRDDLRLSSALYYFLLDDEDNSTMLFGQLGTYGAGFTDDDGLGWEWDVYLDYQFNEDVSAQLAAGIFFPGDAIEDSFNGTFNPVTGAKLGELNEDDEAIFLRGSVKITF